MSERNIVVTYRPPAGHRELLAELLGGQGSLVFLKDVDPGAHEPVLRKADILLSWNPAREIRPHPFAVLERVAFIQLISAGVDHLPFADIPARIVIAGNSGAYAAPMAEHVLALILALAKRLLPENERLRKGDFDQLTPNRRLSGLAAGILGFGGIGRASARLMRAFGMRIFAINTTGESPAPTEFIGTPRDLERVLRESDVVLVSLPLTKATQGLIGRKELEWMKPEAILINVSRGAVIDQKALYAHALNHPGFLLGIDAWWSEPFTGGGFRLEYPFLDLPNVIGSPHNSAVVPGSLLEGARQAAENIIRFLTGEALTGVVRRADYS